MMYYDKKGITLIALVITIVVLIILAAVAINLSLGNNGIFNRAKTAKEQYANAQDYEEEQIAKYTNEIDSFVSNRAGTSKVTVLYDGRTDSKGYINATTGEAASRTLYDNVNDYDFVYIYGGYKNGSDERCFMTPAIIHRSFYDDDLAAGGVLQYGSNFATCYFNSKIDSINNKIILLSRGWECAVIIKVIGVKY